MHAHFYLGFVKNSEGKELAVVSNQIAVARHKLDPRQQKVLVWGISKIARDDGDFLTQTLTVAEFAKLTETTSGNIYAQMERVTKSLLRSIIEIQINDGDRKRVAFQWLSHCVYLDKKGAVEIRFHEKLRPYLLELKNRFTQLRLENFYQFRSGYTIRFFERIEMLRGLNRETWKMSLDELRDWLGIEPEAYAFFGLLRAKTLDVAQLELDIKSDWSFAFEEVKLGRKIVGVEFRIRRSRTPNESPSRERWKTLGAEQRAAVLKHCQTLVAFEDKSEKEILADDRFWGNLNGFIDTVRGQGLLNFESKPKRVKVR